VSERPGDRVTVAVGPGLGDAHPAGRENDAVRLDQTPGAGDLEPFRAGVTDSTRRGWRIETPPSFAARTSASRTVRARFVAGKSFPVSSLSRTTPSASKKKSFGGRRIAGGLFVWRCVRNRRRPRRRRGRASRCTVRLPRSGSSPPVSRRRRGGRPAAPARSAPPKSPSRAPPRRRRRSRHPRGRAAPRWNANGR